MESTKLLNKILGILDMTPDNGLVSANASDLTHEQQRKFRKISEDASLDAVFFINATDYQTQVPIIYFSAVDSYDERKIGELHRLSWNMGEAPLLFVVTPSELLVFNNYQYPILDEKNQYNFESALIERIDLISEIEEKRIETYNRVNILSGNYWQGDERFNIDNRIDSILISNLDHMRVSMLKSIKDDSIVHSLLSRVILIKYLEDRKDSKGNRAFPNDFFDDFRGGSLSFSDVLCDKEASYKLFDFFHRKFSGDVFNILPNEKQSVTQDDLNLIREFVLGTVTMPSGQLNLWTMYSFDHIPIQLISTIYEMFFQSKVELSKINSTDSKPVDRKGTYYTPYHLVELLYDEIYPWNQSYDDNFRIFDPSCGSGIFLVEGYKRILLKWMYKNNNTIPDAETMKKLLKRHIFGVDIDVDALRIASFSLSLVLCDFLEPLNIWNDLTFPALINENLFASDFFDNTQNFNNYKFDLVVGNPPWESKLSQEAEQYNANSKHPIGDKQIAQLFTWKASELLSENGNACLLMPSKGLLYNISKNNEKYRKELLKNNNVTTIINLTDYRKTLFKNAKFPATALIYNNRIKERGTHLIYCTPKATSTLEDYIRFIIEPLDVNKIPFDLLEEKYSWKIGMFGAPRDIELVGKLKQTNSNLLMLEKKYNLMVSEGYSIGNKKDEYLEYLDYYNVSPRNFENFYIERDYLSKNKNTKFERIRSKSLEIYEPPHLLIKQSPVKNRIFSAVLDYPAVFSISILGIAGPEKVLKYISLIVNSMVSSYYFMMTSGRWLIERGELEAGEFRNMPIPLPSEEDLSISEVLYEKYKAGELIDLDELDEFAFSCYNLTNHDISLIRDMYKYTYGLYGNNKKLRYRNKCSQDIINKYGDTIIDIFKNSFGREHVFSCKVIYSINSPLLVMKIDINSSEEVIRINSSSSIELEKVLRKLDELLLQRKSQSLYVRRSLTIYDKKTIYIIHPNQERYWTYSQACREADDIYMKIMMVWRETL